MAAAKQFRSYDGIKNDQNTVYSSHSAANGAVFAVIGERLWALCNNARPGTVGAAAPVAAAPKPARQVRLARPAAGVPAVSRDAIKRNWPNLRGPFGQGIACDAAPPTSFDIASGKNVLWKTPVPRTGASSPVVWEGRVFLTSADENRREVYCFDAASGKMLWRHADWQTRGVPKVSEKYVHAGSTGATDGKRFFAIFSTGDLVAVDMNGAVVWSREFGTPRSAYGYASSLIVYKHLFVQVDDSSSPTLYALDPATGKTVWQKTRSVRESWASPIVVVSGDYEMVVLAENPTATAYDVNTGEAILSKKCLAGEVAPSPAFGKGTLIVANENAKLSAISLISGSVAWSAEDDLPNVASPLATDEFVFTADASGMVNCYDIDNGRKLWAHEFSESFYPSPVLAAGRIYAMDNGGTMHVFRASKTFASIAESKLGEESLATPAFAGRTMFIRGKGNLYCIGTK